MKFMDFLKENTVVLDGGMGSLLIAAGLKAGEATERWNISNPDVVKGIHRDYFSSGSNVINTNTFGAYDFKLGDDLGKLVEGAFEIARRARDESNGDHEKYISLDLGPTGKMLEPFGDDEFEDVMDIFARTVELGVKNGAELITIETMIDLEETRAALEAAAVNSDLPVLLSHAYGDNGRLMTGAAPIDVMLLAEEYKVAAMGLNCAYGPRELFGIVGEYLELSESMDEDVRIPVLFKPNAGAPRRVDGVNVYDVLPEDFAADVASMVKKGVRLAGGCCGTTPEYIKALCEYIR